MTSEEGHHMEMILEFSLRGEDEIVKARGILKNILNYALGGRLENIKNALPAFEKSRVKGKGPTIRAGMSTVAPSEAGSGFTFQLPITPRSSTLLDDENHSFMHDLESFFWVLFWICVHYSEAGRDIGPTEFECWNYESTGILAELKKGLVSDERDFLKTAEGKFTDHYQPLIPCVNRLRRKVFPSGGRWRDPNPKLYDEMREILRAARHDLEGPDAPRDVA